MRAAEVQSGLGFRSLLIAYRRVPRMAYRRVLQMACRRVLRMADCRVLRMIHLRGERFGDGGGALIARVHVRGLDMWFSIQHFGSQV